MRAQPPAPERRDFSPFFAPAALAAVVLLAFNDYVLKRHFPGVLSGKLSDVAVCFFLPLYLSALVGVVAPGWALLRLTLASVVTAVLFAGLELSDTAVSVFCHFNDRAARLLGIEHRCRLTRDPTDLLTLVFVPLAWVYGWSRLRRSQPDIHVRDGSPAGPTGA